MQKVIDLILENKIIVIVRGIGSDIANKQLIEAGDFAAIENTAKRYTEQIKAFKA